MAAWHMQQYQSGSTVITNGDIAIYLHDFISIAGGEQPLTDAQLDAKKFRYAQWLRDILNKAEPPAPDNADWLAANRVASK